MDGSTPAFFDSSLWQGRIFLGEWVPGSAGTQDITAPADGARIAQVGQGSTDDLRRAAAAAAAAQPEWEATDPAVRAAILNRAADLLERHKDELLPWIIRETGSIPIKAGVEIADSAGFLRAAADAAQIDHRQSLPASGDRTEEVIRVAHGAVGVISPFNFPLILSMRAVAAALACGNAVVLKPDPRTPITGGVMVARALQDAGLPRDVLQVVPGGPDVGAALCEDRNIAMVSFTGSPGVGAKVGEACGRTLKRVQLELGGKNAIIVMEDADLDIAASNCAWGAWLHQGQICMATGLILAPAAQANALADRLVTKAHHLPVGDPSKDECALGPLIAPQEATRIEEIIADALDKGATLRAGGKAQGGRVGLSAENPFKVSVGLFAR